MRPTRLLMVLTCFVIGVAADELCDSSAGSSITSAGVGNSVAQANLIFGPRCPSWVSALGIDYAYDADQSTYVLVGITAVCAGNDDQSWFSIGDFRSTATSQPTQFPTAPPGGWSSIDGTFASGGITSLDIAGTPEGACYGNRLPHVADAL